jgi:hypothetical protein
MYDDMVRYMPHHWLVNGPLSVHDMLRDTGGDMVSDTLRGWPVNGSRHGSSGGGSE